MGIAEWLRDNGFEIIENTEAGLVLRIRPPHQLVDEADRVMKMLQDEFRFVFDPTKKTEDGLAASIQASYDPVTAEALLTITALT